MPPALKSQYRWDLRKLSLGTKAATGPSMPRVPVTVRSASAGKPAVHVFVGPEKTGTTTIFDLLPFARVPAQKEMFFLSRRRDTEAEIARIEAQLAVQDAAYVVEPTYFVSDFARDALARLAAHYELQVIHTRRDPVERMVSHYLHHKAKGRVSSPEAAVAAYPEIVEASQYETYSALWRASLPAFSVIEVSGQADLSVALSELGIVPSMAEGATLRSNSRMAPRSVRLARAASALWTGMIALKLNRLVPRGLKNRLKGRVYYGGAPVEVTQEERECLKRMLSTID